MNLYYSQGEKNQRLGNLSEVEIWTFRIVNVTCSVIELYITCEIEEFRNKLKQICTFLLFACLAHYLRYSLGPESFTIQKLKYEDSK